MTLLRAGKGLADAELDVPNTPELIYRIGSMTKPFTAMAVMSLQEADVLRIDDIPDLFGELAAVPVLQTRAEIDRVLERSGDVALKSPPGTRYSYSNFNYMLLGYVIEVATGEPYESVLRRTVFGPARLNDTAYDDVWAIVPRRVVGYVRKGGDLRNANYHDHAAFAAGGLQSTVDDLLRWSEAFFTGKIVAPSTVKQMLTPGEGDYGLGWQTLLRFGRVMHNHTGGMTGFSSHLAYYPQDDVTIILLSNVEDDPVKTTAFDLAAIVFGLPPAN